MCYHCVLPLCQEMLAHMIPVNLTWAPQSLNPERKEILCVMPVCTDPWATLQVGSVWPPAIPPGGPGLWTLPLRRSGEAGTGLPLLDLQLETPGSILATKGKGRRSLVFL